MLGLLVLSSHDGTCGGRRSLLFLGDISSALRDVMQKHTDTRVLVEWRSTSEIWRSASGLPVCTIWEKRSDRRNVIIYSTTTKTITTISLSYDHHS